MKCRHRGLIRVTEVGHFSVSYDVLDGRVIDIGESGAIETGEAFIECVECGKSEYFGPRAYRKKGPTWVESAREAVRDRYL